MAKKQIPFFSNTKDATHCVQAAFRSMLKYFLPDREFSWAELDELSKKEEGKGTWWFPLLLEIQKFGLEIIDVSPFDLGRYYEEGEEYLIATQPPEVVGFMLHKSNLTKVKQYIPKFLEAVDFQNRTATLEELKKLVSSGWLVGVDLNSRTLNKKEGYSSHMVTVFGCKDGYVIFHDPGLPPCPRRVVSEKLFLQAWEYTGKENKSLVALRKAP
jgi:hypothetical protein